MQTEIIQHDITPPAVLRVRCIARPKVNALRPDESYDVGEVYDLPLADAQRWIRRGVMERV